MFKKEFFTRAFLFTYLLYYLFIYLYFHLEYIIIIIFKKISNYLKKLNVFLSIFY